MRMIGNLSDEAQARNFRDFLYVQGIDNQVETDKDGTWSIWVHSEEDLERAKSLLAQYQQNPADAKFQNNSKAAEELREQKRQEQASYEKRVKERRQLFQPMAAYGFGTVTFILILASVVVFILSKFGYDFSPVYALFISMRDINGTDQIHIWQSFLHRIANYKSALVEIRAGQIWRLVTPMFVHMNFPHIFFNMLWLRDLGSMIEARQGSLIFLILVLVFAVGSDVAQYFMNGPFFGGMSGVIYGLAGYVWIRGKLDPKSGVFLHSSTVTMMIIWFFVCLIGFMGPVANTAHGAGLVMGMAWGALSSLPRRWAK
jgi:GlpG protein